MDIGKTVAIGDYDNDIPMLKAAGFGIAVANASAAARGAANFTTASNDENAVAHVIYRLADGTVRLQA